MAQPEPAPEEVGSTTGPPLIDGWEVSPRAVRDAMARRSHAPDGLSGSDPVDAGLILLDCREPHEFETARIDGAMLVPMGEIPARLQELSEHADDRVVVYCHHGQRSLQVAMFLREQGFEDVWSMAGGIDAWSRGIDPSVPRY